MDFDLGLAALAAFRDRIADAGLAYPHLFALRPNTGMATGRELDGDGRRGGPRDAQGYGRFAGQGGLALLSRWPVADWQDHSAFLWRDLPGTLIAADDPAREIQRLSSTGHWSVTLAPPGAAPLTLLAFHATPPVFDGPEDRNGRRNHDEILFWRAYLDGALGAPPPGSRFLVVENANLDPKDGDGRHGAIRSLLNDPRLQDPAPARGAGAGPAEDGVNRRHEGDPLLDTADWDDVRGPGNLRVDYVLPSADWTVTGAGILWPDRPSGGGGTRRSRHGLVWVDLSER